MERIFLTNGSEKMFFQWLSSAGPLTEFYLGVYGVGPMRGEDLDAIETVSMSGAIATAASASSGNVNLTGINSVTPDVNTGAASNGTLRVVYASNSPGIGAHDAATANAGFRCLAVARSTTQTAVAAGDDVHFVATTAGELVLAGYSWANSDIKVELTANSVGLGVNDTATANAGMRDLYVARSDSTVVVNPGDDVHPSANVAGETVIAGYNWPSNAIRCDLVASSLGLGLHDTATEDDGMRALWVARAAQQTAVAAGDDVHPVANVNGELILAGYDWATGKLNVQFAVGGTGSGIGNHDAATANDGFRALGVARTDDSVTVASGDDVHLSTTTAGKLVLAGYDWTNNDLRVELTASSSGMGSHDTGTGNAGMRALFVARSDDSVTVNAGDDVHPSTTTAGKVVVAGYNWSNADIAVELTANSVGLGVHDTATGNAGMRALFVARSDDSVTVAAGDDVHPSTTTAGKVVVAGYDWSGDVVKVSLGTASGIGTHDAATANAGFRGLAVATSTDLADVAANDDVHLVATLDGKLIIAGYDRLTNANRVEEVDPLSMQFAEDKFAEANVGTGTYTYYLDCSGYTWAGWQLQLTVGAATVYDFKFYVSVEADDPDLSARTYVDVTNQLYGAAAITAAGWYPDFDGICRNATSIKIELSLTNGSNDTSFDIDVKRTAL